MQSESVIRLPVKVIQFLKVVENIFGPILAKLHWSTNTVDLFWV